MAKLLLHSCCGPCSTAVLERLLNETSYNIGVYYYNPNISPLDEYEHRKAEQIRYIKQLNSSRVSFVDADYTPEVFYACTKGLEGEPEGGARCALCFKLRLGATARFAKTNGYDIFATTLTVSPHKNAPLINSIGALIGEECGIEYLVADFKKKEGFKRSIILAKENNLYRQNYCGCAFSLKESLERDAHRNQPTS